MSSSDVTTGKPLYVVDDSMACSDRKVSPTYYLLYYIILHCIVYIYVVAAGAWHRAIYLDFFEKKLFGFFFEKKLFPPPIYTGECQHAQLPPVHGIAGNVAVEVLALAGGVQ